MNPIKIAIKTMGAIFRPIEATSCHPEALNHLSDDALGEMIEAIHFKRIEDTTERGSPNDLQTGYGGTVFIGYDSEWVENGPVLNALSYQFYLVGQVGEVSATFFPESGRYVDRLSLAKMLSALIARAMETGCILDYPTNVILAGFFLRADLAMLSDLIEFKTKLSNVGGKIATTHKPVTMELDELGLFRRDLDHIDSDHTIVCGPPEAAHAIKISFYDVAKHAPEKTRLSDLGRCWRCPS